MKWVSRFLCITALVLGGRALATEAPVYGPRLEGFASPWPLKTYRFSSQRQMVEMNYMDVRPAHPNGRVAMLLHGKNFCAATWETTIRALVRAGWRVIAPDQIGFCTSSKPDNYQFSFAQLATNTHDLLLSLDVEHPVLIGHSTGGMLAVRYALMFPRDVQQLVLVDPVGLENWQAKGVPYRTIDEWYAGERGKTADAIRAYERRVYYDGKWNPAWERWVQMLAGMYRSPEGDAVAWNSARLYDMIFTQPVVQEFPNLHVPTVLMIGDRDITAIGAEGAPPDVRAQLGHYPELGRAAVAAIPRARLVEFPTLGHAPQIQDPAVFHARLFEILEH
ncbi:alpha/beta fold hydrolase [Acetobacter estunensis]|uniref:alpha/beta fold hydrolase n=1 Tax=Acetobacter estunensis TaxID=104097 RepID=UPI001C2D07BE|nr:alpha/beta hydrolase [Acetobacter estunensis]MBV1837042.1 alpha/beta hydrolase [Acetobacter estunensis]